MTNAFNGKDEKALQALMHEKCEKLREFRFAMSGSKVKNVKECLALRKDIARIATEQSRLRIAAGKK